MAAQRGFAASEGADRVGAPAVDGARVTFADGAGHRIAADPTAPNRVVVVVKDTQGSGDLRIDRFVSGDGARRFGPRRAQLYGVLSSTAVR